jgi:hypothetical protein
MTVRKRALPEGWYPDDEASARAELDACFEQARRASATEGRAVSAVAPHAGWYFCGSLAASAVASLRHDAQTIVVCGGHLSEADSSLMAMEDAFSTPFGLCHADAELRNTLSARFSFLSDSRPDNTVEVLLPIVKRRFPDAKVLWLRLPASLDAFRIGTAIAEASSALGKSIAVLGSTDLTHYGPNYGFVPKGTGGQAERWVRETNDRRLIDALLAGDAKEALSRALEEGSACSPGGALAALGFASALGAAGRLMAYGTSADRMPSASFVGYAAICWEVT